MSALEIVEFEQRFAPHYIHIDEKRAATGPYGGLIASGWHTTGIMMRLYADHFLSSVASLGGPVSTNYVSSSGARRKVRYAAQDVRWYAGH